jgi:hypothetical protein
MFDLNRDGRADYLVLNGGSLLHEDLNRRVWMNFHFIDTNHDGRTDIAVYNAVDLDGNDYLDEGITAWLHDTDFDGTVDRAEYLGPDLNREIEKKDDAFHIRRAHGMHVDVQATDPDAFKALDMILSDINSMLK